MQKNQLIYHMFVLVMSSTLFFFHSTVFHNYLKHTENEKKESEKEIQQISYKKKSHVTIFTCVKI